MTGTRSGGKKSARKLGKNHMSMIGTRGGKAKVAKGAAKWTPEKRAEAGRKGGLAKARKYQDPNFDKEEYWKCRQAKLRGQGDKPRTTISIITPDEHLRRTNLDELKRQKGIDV